MFSQDIVNCGCKWRDHGTNHNAEFIFRVLINRGILAKEKANAKTSHKITSGVGKVVIKKSVYR